MKIISRHGRYKAKTNLLRSWKTKTIEMIELETEKLMTL